MKYLIFTICTFFLGLTLVSGQVDDELYNYYFKEGEKFLETKEYQKANKLFKAAEISTRDLGKQRLALIQAILSDDFYIAALETARENALAAQREAIASRDSARYARADAQKKKRFSDAIYLSFIADQEIVNDGDEGHDKYDSVAMQLAWDAIDLISEDTLFVESIHSVFGRAVYRATRQRTLNHKGAISNILVNSDGSYYTQGRDSLVIFQDLARKGKFQLQPGEFIQDIQVYAGGRIGIVVTGKAHSVSIWDPNNLKKAQYEIITASRVNKVLYEHNLQFLCIAMQQAQLQFWNLKTDKYQFGEHPGSWVRDIQFSPDSTKILSRGADGTIGIWDLQGKPITPVFAPHEKYVYGALFSPDGQHILTYSADQTAKLWNLNGTLNKTLASHANPVFSAQYSSNGALILTYSLGNDVCIWDRNGDLQLALLPSPYAFSDSDVLEIDEATFHPDNESILAISGQNVQRINMQGLATRNFDHGQSIRGIDISNDGRFLLTHGAGAQVNIWDLDSQNYNAGETKGHRVMEIVPEGSPQVIVAKFGHDGKYVYLGMSSGMVQVIPTPGIMLEALKLKPVTIPEDFLEKNNIHVEKRSWTF